MAVDLHGTADCQPEGSTATWHIQWRRDGGGAGGLVPRAGAKLDFFFFLIGSQWGIQDFDKGGSPKTNLALLRHHRSKKERQNYLGPVYRYTDLCTSVKQHGEVTMG